MLTAIDARVLNSIGKFLIIYNTEIAKLKTLPSFLLYSSLAVPYLNRGHTQEVSLSQPWPLTGSIVYLVQTSHYIHCPLEPHACTSDSTIKCVIVSGHEFQWVLILLRSEFLITEQVIIIKKVTYFL